jgi:hypothetical protein
MTAQGIDRNKQGEDSLSYEEAERVIALVALPCALVENSGASSGFVMPVIPEQFN